MGYVVFRGVSTEGMGGVYVQKMPSHKKASKRFSEFYVKGRDGSLHIDEGYANFEVSVYLVLVDSHAEMRQTVNAWADGRGRLISSDDPSKAYLATVRDEVQWTRVQANNGFYDTAKIVFDCEPYMVEAVESTIELTATGTLINPGSLDAFPMIKVYGSGNVSFSFNGESISIDGMTSGVPITIDCETGYIFTATGSATMRGEIPKLSKGTNTITFGSNLSKLVITPRWRWL